MIREPLMTSPGQAADRMPEIPANPVGQCENRLWGCAWTAPHPENDQRAS
jgi:hypothetical protein